MDNELERLYQELLQEESKPVATTQNVDAEFILNLADHLPQDKDITLKDYLNQYAQLSQQIATEEKKRNEDTEQLHQLISDLSPKPTEAYKTTINFVNKLEKNEKVFSSLNKAPRTTPMSRISDYANTEMKIINADYLEPLQLERYSTKDT